MTTAETSKTGFMKAPTVFIPFSNLSVQSQGEAGGWTAPRHPTKIHIMITIIFWINSYEFTYIFMSFPVIYSSCYELLLRV